MKHCLTVLFFLTMTFFTTSGLAATGFIGSTITEYDMTGCHHHSQDPRCKRIIKVACKSICKGHFGQKDEFGQACKDLCKPEVTPAKAVKKDIKQDPKSRLQ